MVEDILNPDVNSVENEDELFVAGYDEEGNLVKEGLLGNLKVEGFENSSEWNQARPFYF